MPNSTHRSNQPLRILTVIVSILLLFIVSGISWAQSDIQPFVEAHAINVKTTADLSQVAERIAENKIVFLGEQRHGDAPTFLIKTELVKLLHENHGFDVIVFESDFASINHQWRAHKDGRITTDELLPGNIALTWKACAEFKPIMQYIRDQLNTENKLIYAGMDVGASLKRIDSLFIYDLLHYMDGHSIAYSPLLIEFLSELDAFNSRLHPSARQDLNDEIVRIENQFSSKHLDTSFYFQALHSIRQPYHRDRHMADNLTWLSQQAYKGKKIIVWCHNNHFAQRTSLVSNPDEDQSTIVDHLNLSSLREDIFTVAFTSNKGEAGGELGLETYTVAPPKKASLETWMSQEDNIGSFIDFSSFASTQKGQSFYMKARNHRENLYQPWHDIFDAVYLVEEMYPCRTDQ